MSKFSMISWTIFILWILLILIGCKEAPPMGGQCETITAEHYSGTITKDIKKCIWKGYIWNCYFRPETQYDYWQCDVIGPVPIEQTKIGPAK